MMKEISCLNKIEYQRNTWTQLSLINDPVVIGLQSAKGLRVLRFCAMSRQSSSTSSMQRSLEIPSCRSTSREELQRFWRRQRRVSGIRVEYFPRFTTLQLCDKISDLLSSLAQTPEAFTGRILYMSMFKDISCEGKGNKEQCLKNADLVKTFARRFGIGQMVFHWTRFWEKVVSFRKQPARRMGLYCGRYATKICRKWTSHLPCNDTLVQRKIEK